MAPGGSPYIKFAFPYSMMKVTTILITAACLAGSFFPLCRCGFRSGGGRFIYGSLFRGRGSSPAGKRNEKGRLRHECGLEAVQGREGAGGSGRPGCRRFLLGVRQPPPTALSFFRKRPAAVPTTRGRYGTGKHLFLPPGWKGGGTPCILRASWERARYG